MVSATRIQPDHLCVTVSSCFRSVARETDVSGLLVLRRRSTGKPFTTVISPSCPQRFNVTRPRTISPQAPATDPGVRVSVSRGAGGGAGVGGVVVASNRGGGDGGGGGRGLNFRVLVCGIL